MELGARLTQALSMFPRSYAVPRGMAYSLTLVLRYWTRNELTQAKNRLSLAAVGYPPSCGALLLAVLQELAEMWKLEEEFEVWGWLSFGQAQSMHKLFDLLEAGAPLQRASRSSSFQKLSSNVTGICVSNTRTWFTACHM